LKLRGGDGGRAMLGGRGGRCMMLMGGGGLLLGKSGRRFLVSMGEGRMIWPGRRIYSEEESFSMTLAEMRCRLYLRVRPVLIRQLDSRV